MILPIANHNIQSSNTTITMANKKTSKKGGKTGKGGCGKGC